MTDFKESDSDDAYRFLIHNLKNNYGPWVIELRIFLDELRCDKLKLDLGICVKERQRKFHVGEEKYTILILSYVYKRKSLDIYIRFPFRFTNKKIYDLDYVLSLTERSS